MATTIKELTDFFQEIGANDVKHTNKTYVGHAIGVYNDLKRWGCDEELAQVGIFHSIYGTEAFQGFTLPVDRRPDVMLKTVFRAAGLLNRLLHRFEHEIAFYSFFSRYCVSNLQQLVASQTNCFRFHLLYIRFCDSAA